MFTMRLDHLSRVAQRPSRARKLAWWRRYLVLLALVGFVALKSIEATHYHKTAKDERDCVVCHVVGHNTFNLSVSDLALDHGFLVSFQFVLPALSVDLVKISRFHRTQIRAPPAPLSTLI